LPIQLLLLARIRAIPQTSKIDVFSPNFSLSKALFTKPIFDFFPSTGKRHFIPNYARRLDKITGFDGYNALAEDG